MTPDTQYKIALQAILMAYTILCPQPTSTDDLKGVLTQLKNESNETPKRLYQEALNALVDGSIYDNWYQGGS